MVYAHHRSWCQQEPVLRLLPRPVGSLWGRGEKRGEPDQEPRQLQVLHLRPRLLTAAHVPLRLHLWQHPPHVGAGKAEPNTFFSQLTRESASARELSHTHFTLSCVIIFRMTKDLASIVLFNSFIVYIIKSNILPFDNKRKTLLNILGCCFLF